MRPLRLGLLLAIGLAAPACGGTAPTQTPAPTTIHPLASPVERNGTTASRTISSSRLVQQGRVRCTAVVTTPVAVGHALRVVFDVRDVSQRPVRVRLGFGSFWLLVRSPDGTSYDTRHVLVAARSAGGPYIPPTRLRPGASATRALGYLRVRWSGPLRITPGCGTARLPVFQVGVTTPGPPADGRRPVTDVVAASGHLLDHCRPEQPGVAVTGRIDPPAGGKAPPLQARCSVSIRRERGFDVAQVLVVTPPGLRGVHLRQPYGQLAWLQSGQTAEAVAWTFVVTRDGAISVDSSEVDATKPADRMAPDWQWTGSEWQGPGGSRCGGFGGGGGGAAGPLVEWVSACPS